MSDEPTIDAGGADPAPDAGGQPFYSGFEDTELGGWVESKFQGTAPSVERLASSYRNLEKMVGAEKAGRTVTLPGPDADPDALGEFFTRLGRPEQPDGYKVPEGIQVNEARLTEARQKAHEIGLTDKQFEAMISWDNEFVANMSETVAAERKQAAEKAEAELRQEWGGAYDQRVEAVNKAAEALEMTQDQLKGLREAMGPAAAMKFVYSLGARLGEDLTPTDVAGKKSAELTPDAAQAEWNRLRNDQGFQQAWLNKSDPQHNWALEKKAQLMRQIAGVKNG
jgi:hypothetical protein